MELCRLQDIDMRYGREEVLRGVELPIQRGSILGLVGENGSGKSTLLKILAGILRPDAGYLQAAAGRPRVGYMPENCQWYPYLSGAEVLRYFARFSGGGAEAQQEALRRVGLWEVRDKKVAAYSKGMRQKLGLAQAIVGDPELLILDEPTNGLDPRGIIDFYEILGERAQAGTTVVLSSHLLAEIEGHITHVAFLRDGHIVRSGACADLIAQAGLRSRVILRQVADTAGLQQVASVGGWEAHEEPDGLEVVLAREHVGALLQALATCEVDIGDVHVLHPGLNDLYLSALEAGAPRRNGQARPALGRPA